MSSLFGDMDGTGTFFLGCALIGSGFVVTLLVIEFLGMGSNDHSHIEVGDSDVSFKILSLHSITAFLMMFGLTGFALYRQNPINLLGVFLIALAVGGASVWFMGKLLKFALSLQSSGNLTLDDTIGGEGEVYLTIPPRGTGRVLVNFRSRLREYDAMAQDQEGIKTGERIRVVNVRNNVLLVERTGRPTMLTP